MPVYNSDFNFANKEERNLSFNQKVVDWSLQSGKKIIIITEAIVLISLFAKFKLVRDSNAINSKLENLKLEVLQKTEEEKRFNNIIADINKFKAIKEGQIDWVDRFLLINQNVADQVILTSATYTADQATIKAEVSDIRAFGTFIGKILGEERITSAFLVSSEFKQDDELFIFEMVLRIKDVERL